MSSNCYHCGQAVVEPGRWQLTEPCRANEQLSDHSTSSQQRDFCCPACVAVYQCIQAGGFFEYYKQRTEYAQTPDLEPEPDKYQELDAIVEDLAFLSVDEQSGISSAKLLLTGLHCGACAWLVESALAPLSGIESAQVNLQQSVATVRWRTGQQKLSSIMRTIHKLGYVPGGWSRHAHSELLQHEKSQLQRRLGIAGLLMMQVGMLSLGLYAGEWQGMEASTQYLLRLASLILSTFSMLYCATPFIRGAFNALRSAKLTMDVPITLALGTAYVLSVFATLFSTGVVYFDTVCMFVFFLLLSRFLEISSRTQRRSVQHGRTPLLVSRRRPHTSGGYSIESVPIQQLQAGDAILCRAGESAVTDGFIIEQESLFDESAFTGEHTPVPKKAGDSVLAGSVNTGAHVWLKASSNAEHSSLSYIDKLIDDAQANKPAYAQLIDRISPWFIGGVLMLATITAVYWLSVEPAFALAACLAVLIVSCPCALALATPVALAEAHQVARRLGIVPASGRFLQRMPEVSDIVFDKTGTLTSGDLSVEVTLTSEQELRGIWQIAASLELVSLHPLAKAIQKKHDGELLEVDNACETLGRGVEGQIDGIRYRLGKPQWCLELCKGALNARSDESKNRLTHNAVLSGFDSAPCASVLSDAAPCDSVLCDSVLCDSKGILAKFTATERLRADTKSSLKILSERGYILHMLSGDTQANVEQVAEQLELENRIGGASPQQKLDYIRSLQNNGKTVLMVGDGVNDAPVLAGADVSIAVHSAADISKAKADASLLGENSQSIPDALSLAAAAQKTVRQNIVWAISYNSLSLPMAAIGFLPPWAAALGMSVSSLIVVLNSRRLGNTINKQSARVDKSRNGPGEQTAIAASSPNHSALLGS